MPISGWDHQDGSFFGMEVVTLSDCRGAGASSMLSWLNGVKHLFHWGDQLGEWWGQSVKGLQLLLWQECLALLGE